MNMFSASFLLWLLIGFGALAFYHSGDDRTKIMFDPDTDGPITMATRAIPSSVVCIGNWSSIDTSSTAAVASMSGTICQSNNVIISTSTH